jgi:hypothetical protein
MVLPHALGNTVSPSLPFIMSQFLHGRAEGKRVLREAADKRRWDGSARLFSAHMVYFGEEQLCKRTFWGVHTWRINAFDRNNERIAIKSGVPLRQHYVRRIRTPHLTQHTHFSDW